MARRLAIGSVQLSDRAPRIVAAGGEAELEALPPPRGAHPGELRAGPCGGPRPETPPAPLPLPRARGIVTLATGPAGPLSRLVLPAAGSLLAYGHVGHPTAPSGQLPVAELAALLRRLLPP